MAKAAPWDRTDAHARKRGQQTGLDILVVYVVNDENWLLGFLGFGGVVNVLSFLFGEHGCKVKI